MPNSFSAGDLYDFGTVSFSEQDIIDYALKNDPLNFHINKEVARSHIFKNIVASGQHAFHHFYVHHWIPQFGSTVLCGLSVDNWSFQKPIFAGSPVRCVVSILKLNLHQDKNSASIKWLFEFINSEGVHFQKLEMTVLHRLNVPDSM